MITSPERILTTPSGACRAIETLSELLVKREAREPYDKAHLDAEMDKAVAHVVEQQKRAGIDIGNDGEQQRVGFQTYVPQRMSGFGGESNRRRGREFEEFPDLVKYLLRRFPHTSKRQENVSGMPGRTGAVTSRFHITSSHVRDDANARAIADRLAPAAMHAL